MAFDKAAFSARLRGKRAELDIMQQQLADRCGNVSAAAIAQYGTTAPARRCSVPATTRFRRS